MRDRKTLKDEYVDPKSIVAKELRELLVFEVLLDIRDLLSQIQHEVAKG